MTYANETYLAGYTESGYDGEPEALSAEELTRGPYALESTSGPSELAPEWVVKAWQAARDRIKALNS